MSKRFTDNDVWNKKWFMDLEPLEKAAWYYLKDKCDTVGVWDVNSKLADCYLGGSVDWDAFLLKCNGNIIVLSDGKWWLVDFCTFQYGTLSLSSQPHCSYIALLKKHDLLKYFTLGDKGYTLNEPLGKACLSLKDKEEDKDKEKATETEEDQEPELFLVPEPSEEETTEKDAKQKQAYGSGENIFLTKQEVARLKEEFGDAFASECIEYLSLYFQEKPSYNNKIKNHNLTIRRWVIDAVRQRNERRDSKPGYKANQSSMPAYRSTGALTNIVGGSK